jgi:hypothetical protein
VRPDSLVVVARRGTLFDGDTKAAAGLWSSSNKFFFATSATFFDGVGVRALLRGDGVGF